MNVSAVSVFSVLAGANRPCAFFAARISPVSRSPMTYDEACTAGGGAIPGTRLVTTPAPASRGPPTTVVSSWAAEAGIAASVKHTAPATVAHTSRWRELPTARRRARVRGNRAMTGPGYRDGLGR